MKKILSIDGGGIRGVIPATLMSALERRTGHHMAELFDLIAGTSTGGILALGLTLRGQDGKPKYDAAALLDLYDKEGKTIFRHDPWRRIWALDNLLDERYPADGIEKVLKDYFGDVPISEAMVDVLVTSYDIERRRPFFFKRQQARDKASHDWMVRQAARATSAAPTYFEPAKLEVPGSDDYFALIDGGVFANNPAMCAYAEARAIWPDDEDLLVVSLGTGQLTRRIPYDQAKNWGLAKWAQPLLGVVFDGVSDSVDYELKNLCHDSSTQISEYHRFQVTLTKGNDDMDDASHTNIQALKFLAEELLEQREVEIKQLCDQLVAGLQG